MCYFTWWKGLSNTQFKNLDNEEIILDYVGAHCNHKGPYEREAAVSEWENKKRKDGNRLEKRENSTLLTLKMKEGDMSQRM